MNVSFVWQGAFDPSMQQQNSVLTWKPGASKFYLVMGQATVSCGGDNTRGVAFDLVDGDGNSVLVYGPNENPATGASPYNSDGRQTSQAKYASGDPGVVPIVYLKWQPRSDWPVNTPVYVTVSPYTPAGAGSPSTMNDQNYLSITVIEVDQLPTL